MTSRERVYRALEFQSPDRAPRHLWRLMMWAELFAADDLAALLRDFPEDFTGCPEPVLAPGDHSRGVRGKDRTWTDEWGCVCKSCFYKVL